MSIFITNKFRLFCQYVFFIKHIILFLLKTHFILIYLYFSAILWYNIYIIKYRRFSLCRFCSAFFSSSCSSSLLFPSWGTLPSSWLAFSLGFSTTCGRIKDVLSPYWWLFSFWNACPSLCTVRFTNPHGVGQLPLPQHHFGSSLRDSHSRCFVFFCNNFLYKFLLKVI